VADKTVDLPRVRVAAVRAGLRADREPSGTARHRNFASHPGVVAADAAAPVHVIGLAEDSDTTVARRCMGRQICRFAVTLDAQPLRCRRTERWNLATNCGFDRSGLLQRLRPGKMFEAKLLRLCSAALTNKELIVAT
jgi:hypothetical protein